ncbi:uncharacterized protein LOC126666126 [Mercurialis annua]|uniref:uncharacterized protein LOC126666126 n=1 Tax=Mercurialis annua TaxID=3986 RepID=UPI00215F6533|nr:uncharacterized protein LOC126666126 [Mercurialis annua]
MFLFEFDLEDGCNKVLGAGPYTFDQRPLMLKKWSPRMSMDPNEIRSVPIWIQLPDLPWEFLSPSILSKIGSFCGKPLYCDQCTLSITKLGFARILVEIDATGAYPEVVELQDENGAIFNQRIIYEWKPLICEKCCRMGHTKANCRVTQDYRKVSEKTSENKSKPETAAKNDKTEVNDAVPVSEADKSSAEPTMMDEVINNIIVSNMKTTKEGDKGESSMLNNSFSSLVNFPDLSNVIMKDKE